MAQVEPVTNPSVYCPWPTIEKDLNDSAHAPTEVSPHAANGNQPVAQLSKPCRFSPTHGLLRSEQLDVQCRKSLGPSGSFNASTSLGIITIPTGCLAVWTGLQPHLRALGVATTQQSMVLVNPFVRFAQENRQAVLQNTNPIANLFNDIGTV